MDEYAPDDWNYERDGRPDIIFWIHNGESAEQIAATLGTRELPGLAEGAPVSVAFDSGLFSDTLQPGCGSAPGGVDSVENVAYNTEVGGKANGTGL